MELDLFNQPPYEITLPENNRNGNNEAWVENKDHFKSQTEIVREHLERGEEVTGERMYALHRIQDVRPRIAAIKKSLIGTNRMLVERRIKGAHGAKAWVMIKQVA